MPEWLTQTEREEAIYILKNQLTHKKMRSVINREVEGLVARTECVKGNYTSYINNEDLADFLIDVEGVDLLKNPTMREHLVKSLDEYQIETLATWNGETPPRS